MQLRTGFETLNSVTSIFRQGDDNCNKSHHWNSFWCENEGFLPWLISWRIPRTAIAVLGRSFFLGWSGKILISCWVQTAFKGPKRFCRFRWGLRLGRYRFCVIGLRKQEVYKHTGAQDQKHNFQRSPATFQSTELSTEPGHSQYDFICKCVFFTESKNSKWFTGIIYAWHLYKSLIQCTRKIYKSANSSFIKYSLFLVLTTPVPSKNYPVNEQHGHDL